ncbi:hypothetical protein B0W51_06205 [Leuconostoc mesenteroides]|uniref:hypothetical protein n=1 Tax=Leuconostoc mesenteroides TaxID=1245 RepID=UPI000C9B3032|nr:hypothetical protein [Leuconostoc mesenteroides]PND41297.1 hypothetical protein B0W51_06205 [Leuconostoc mesenteroides]
MEISVKKGQLVPFYNFLNELSLVGASSRARTKLNKSILEFTKELNSDEEKMVEEFKGTVGDNGIVTFDNQEVKRDFVKEQSELRNEKIIISESIEGQFDRIKNALENYEKELNGPEAEIYNDLLDILEK